MSAERLPNGLPSAGRFAIVGCRDCKTLQATETRFAQVRCNRCGKRYWLADLKKLWTGDDARQAIAFIQQQTEAPR